MEGPAGGGQQVTHTGQIDRVVGVPAIGRAAPRRHQTGIPQLAQVVRDQVLRLTDQARQLVHHAVAPGQLAQQPPTQGMPRQLQELRRGDIRVNLLRTHTQTITSISLDMSILIDVFW